MDAQTTWTATATRYDRIDGTEDHTEILAADTDGGEAIKQAILDARIQAEDPNATLRWTPQPNGTATARIAHNLYQLTPSN